MSGAGHVSGTEGTVLPTDTVLQPQGVAGGSQTTGAYLSS